MSNELRWRISFIFKAGIIIEGESVRTHLDSGSELDG